MIQRSTIGSIRISAIVPNGAATAAAIVIGSTSRQLHWENELIVKGRLPHRSISSSVEAAMRGSYTAAINGM